VIGIADAVKASTPQALAALREAGLRIVMLTGDNRITAEAVAKRLGITEVEADVLPDKKADVVVRLNAQGRVVAMAGDGVNDAPALAAADVGIAMGAKGATAASESADAVILVDDISRVALAVKVGRDTVRIALQSIWLGIAISVVLMVIAAFGVIPATAGALIQELVDLATILAALRAVGGRIDEREAGTNAVQTDQSPRAGARHTG
jgi:P-type E1-E2 ATPase